MDCFEIIKKLNFNLYETFHEFKWNLRTFTRDPQFLQVSKPILKIKSLTLVALIFVKPTKHLFFKPLSAN